MNKQHRIESIEKGSFAASLGFEIGDEILKINGKEIKDIFDYHFLIDDNGENTIQIKKPDGRITDIRFAGISSQQLGISFENGLMDDYQNCHNKCIFCFIDQMPPGMRETLYFKDDDARLSFLNGNYITMTNMSYEDIDRIIYYRLSPMNISVHTTDPDLRCRMLNNRFAGDIMDKIRKFYDAGITMNGQIVLCKGINDAEMLDKTIEDLSSFLPVFHSLSVVPVGLTRYREGLYPLAPFEKDDAEKVITQIEKWQDHFLKKYHKRFVFASDEWYLLAERELPEEEAYEAFPQIENGVGMLRNFIIGFQEACKSSHRMILKKRTVSVATGMLAAPVIKRLCDDLCKKYPKLTVNVYAVKNDFFGEKITVAGLLTGRDIAAQLKGKDLGIKLLITSDMLRAGEDVFLDDMSVNELEKTLQVPIDIVKSSGETVNALIKKTINSQKGTGNYE